MFVSDHKELPYCHIGSRVCYIHVHPKQYQLKVAEHSFSVMTSSARTIVEHALLGNNVRALILLTWQSKQTILSQNLLININIVIQKMET